MKDETFTLEDFEGEFIEESFIEDGEKETQKGGAGEEQPPGIPDELAAMFRDNLEQAEGNVDEPEPVVEESNSNSMPPFRNTRR